MFVGEGGFTSDNGWGCTLRTGQMLVAEVKLHCHKYVGSEGPPIFIFLYDGQALSRQLLGRGWRRLQRSGIDIPKEMLSILEVINESEGDLSPLSIHRLCAAGRKYG